MQSHADQATNRTITWWRKVREYGDTFEFWNECRTSLFASAHISNEYGDYQAALIYFEAATQAYARRDLCTH